MVNGFSYHPEILSSEESEQLVRHIAALAFRIEKFRGMTLKRTIVCYGNDYITASRSARNPAPPIPEFLVPIRDRAATVAGVDAATLTQAIIWRFPAKAGIDWHIDNPAFGPVVCGISLGASAVMHLGQSGSNVRHIVDSGSLYILRDEARYDWKHKVEGNKAERYSITFRSMR